MKGSATREWVRYYNRSLIENGVLEIGDGYRAKNSEMENDGIPFIRIANLNDGFDFSSADILSAKSVAKAKEKVSQPNDCVITTKGTFGRVGFVAKETQPFVYSPQLCYWRVLDRKVLEPQFIHYWLQGPEFYGQATQIKSSTDMADYANLADQRQMFITAPSLPLQRKIAAILSAYDELIENNKRRIALLEKMAEEIYREWFVRLRFPGHEKVKVEDRPLRSFVQEYIGGDWGEDVQSPSFGNAVYVIRGTDFEDIQQGDISSVPFRYISDSAFRNRKLQAGDLIVENSVNHQSRTTGKSLLVTQHVLDLFNGDVICASFCKLIRPKDTKYSKFLSLNFRLLFSQGLFDYFQNIATNGIANLQAERFMDRHVIPFHGAIDLSIFDSFDTSLIARMIAKLTETRDLLLPRLISGKLSVENLDIQFPPGMAEEMKAEMVQKAAV